MSLRFMNLNVFWGAKLSFVMKEERLDCRRDR